MVHFKTLVSFDLFLNFFLPFFVQWSIFQTKIPIPPPTPFSVLRLLFCIISTLFLCSLHSHFAPPKEMLLSLSIVQFLTNYDVTNRKHSFDPIYSIVQKSIKNTRNESLEWRILKQPQNFSWIISKLVFVLSWCTRLHTNIWHYCNIRSDVSSKGRRDYQMLS